MMLIAYRFWGLNLIRVLSVVGLLLVFSTNVYTMAEDIKAVMSAASSSPSPITTNSTLANLLDDLDLPECDYIGNSTVPDQAGGPFWAVLNRLLILIQVVLCLLAEFSFSRLDGFFQKFLPILSTDFGVGPIGIIECLLGAQILSHKVHTVTMVAAFFLFAVGCLNVILSLIFGKAVKERRSFTVRNAKDHLPRSTSDLAKMAGVPGPVANFAGSVASSVFSEKRDRTSSEESGPSYGSGVFGKQASKFPGANFVISKPIISQPEHTLPKYSAPPSRSNSGRSSSSYGYSKPTNKF